MTNLRSVRARAPVYMDIDGVTSPIAWESFIYARRCATKHVDLFPGSKVTIWRHWPEGPNGRETIAEVR